MSGFFAGFGYLTPFVHIVPYAVDQGISAVDAAFLLSIMGGASTVGRILLGLLADKWGVVQVLRVCFLGMSLSCIVWPFLFSYPALVVFSFVFGFVGGGYISVMPAMCAVAAQMFGTERLSSILGALYSSAAIGNVLGSPLAGIMFDRLGSYSAAILVCAGASSLALFIVMFLEPPRKRRYGMIQKTPSQTGLLSQKDLDIELVQSSLKNTS